MKTHHATSNRGHVTFEVHDGLAAVDIQTRIPKHHAGWQSVTYRGRRYQLFGGIRARLFINVNRPI